MPKRTYRSRRPLTPGTYALTLDQVAAVKALVRDLPAWWSAEKMKRECLRELSIAASHEGTVRRLIVVELAIIRVPVAEVAWGSY